MPFARGAACSFTVENLETRHCSFCSKRRVVPAHRLEPIYLSSFNESSPHFVPERTQLPRATTIGPSYSISTLTRRAGCSLVPGRRGRWRHGNIGARVAVSQRNWFCQSVDTQPQNVSFNTKSCSLTPRQTRKRKKKRSDHMSRSPYSDETEFGTEQIQSRSVVNCLRGEASLGYSTIFLDHYQAAFAVCHKPARSIALLKLSFAEMQHQTRYSFCTYIIHHRRRECESNVTVPFQ